jgi:pimeloyl-ACP methyl ester carboxylesterase
MKILKWTLGLIVVLTIAGGALFYERPLWVADQRLHYRMWRQGERSHFVQLPEGRIHYYEQAANGGEGVPLLIVHGLGGRAEDFAGLMPRFAAQGYHVYAPDLLGYGESDQPSSSDFSITTEENVVLHFMDAMQIPHAYIAGWSMGGWIVLKLALDAPQRVDRLAVYDSAGVVFKSDADTDLFTPTDSVGLERLVRALSPTMKPPPPFARKDVFRKLAARRWVIDRSMRGMRGGKDVVDSRLASMQPPLLIVYGAQDVLTPPSVGETMHQLDPRSVFATVEGCGHFAPVECGGAVSKVTVQFFKAQPPMVGGELKLAR